MKYITKKDLWVKVSTVTDSALRFCVEVTTKHVYLVLSDDTLNK